MANYPDLCKDTLFTNQFLASDEHQARSAGKSIMALLVTWYRRAGQRRQLAHLDQRMLRDIGLSHEDVEAEVAKPFWVA